MAPGCLSVSNLLDDPSFPAGYAADLLRHAAGTKGARINREAALVQLSAVQQALTGAIPSGVLEHKLAFMYLSNADRVKRDLEDYEDAQDVETDETDETGDAL